jgi:hypothetical protein
MIIQRTERDVVSDSPDYLRLECPGCGGGMLVAYCGRYRSCRCAACINAAVGSSLVYHWRKEPTPLFTKRVRRPRTATPKPPEVPIGSTGELFG